MNSDSEDSGCDVAKQLSTAEKEPVVIQTTFDPADCTKEMPSAVTTPFIFEKGLAVKGMRFVKLPHPRHGEYVFFATAMSITEDNEECVLLELQQFKPRYSTFFIGNMVEPQAPLCIATRFDACFLALSMAYKNISSGGDSAQNYVSVTDLLSRDGSYVQLPFFIKQNIERSFSTVCDVKSIPSNPPEGFFRYSEEKAIKWLKQKVLALVDTVLMQELVLGAPLKAENESEKERIQRQMLVEKCARLVAEYVPTPLHSLIFSSVGLDSEQLKSGNTRNVASSHWEQDRRRPRGDENDDFVRKAKKIEKSASVKKLERAGAPQGTPSIMGFFAKKK